VTTAIALFLLVNAAWSFFVWPAFLRRVARDPRARTSTGAATRFLRVHQIIVAVSLLLALGLAVIGVVGLVRGSYA
jgi:hypothetical protein